MLIDCVCDCGRLFGYEKVDCVCDCGRLIVVCEYIIMAPKTKSSAESSQSFDASKFLSYEMQKKFTDQLRIHVIQERRLVQKLQHNVNWTIDANRWEILCEHPELAVVPIVREFYANGKERDDFRVFVRGKWVKFDRTTINHYYELADIEDDQYQALLESEETKWDEIKNALCKETVA